MTVDDLVGNPHYRLYTMYVTTVTVNHSFHYPLGNRGIWLSPWLYCTRKLQKAYTSTTIPALTATCNGPQVITQGLFGGQSTLVLTVHAVNTTRKLRGAFWKI